jgi:hypothetical protein
LMAFLAADFFFIGERVWQKRRHIQAGSENEGLHASRSEVSGGGRADCAGIWAVRLGIWRGKTG